MRIPTIYIDGEMFFLRAEATGGGDRFYWQGAGGRAAYLTEEESAEYGVEPFRGALTRPVDRR